MLKLAIIIGAILIAVVLASRIEDDPHLRHIKKQHGLGQHRNADLTDGWKHPEQVANPHGPIPAPISPHHSKAHRNGRRHKTSKNSKSHHKKTHSTHHRKPSHKTAHGHGHGRKH